MRPEDYFFIPFTIIVVVGAVWLYAKWTWVRILTFIYYSHKSGPSGYFTAHYLLTDAKVLKYI